jgi:hypothetical protein
MNHGVYELIDTARQANGSRLRIRKFDPRDAPGCLSVSPMTSCLKVWFIIDDWQFLFYLDVILAIRVVDNNSICPRMVRPAEKEKVVVKREKLPLSQTHTDLDLDEVRTTHRPFKDLFFWAFFGASSWAASAGPPRNKVKDVSPCSSSY